MDSLLTNIQSPADLKRLPADQIPQLLNELREFLIKNVTETGGHLASNLGVVELSVALHRVFDSPVDKIIWDVGHQSYVHKILTGRRDDFPTLRQNGGLSGFTKRLESPHDPFGAGHSSTSVSAALGIAMANRMADNPAYTIAVVGDGAFTGGLIHEALNNCEKNLRLIIVLNENEMSISPNTGSFAEHLAKIRSTEKYLGAKRTAVEFLRRFPLVGRPVLRGLKAIKASVKQLIYHDNYFESMGLYYLGPTDGNDYAKLELLLKEAKAANESVVLHIRTKKGKGYLPAEENPDLYHSIPPQLFRNGLPAEQELWQPSYSEAFGETLADYMSGDRSICAVTAAMADGTGMSGIPKRFPDRFFDAGIAEGHALTFCAGLAVSGMRPVFAVYSSFLQRAYDNLLHDGALQNLPIVLCIDRAGLNVCDGPTHHGIFDVSFLSHIPNVKILTPLSYASLRLALNGAFTGSYAGITAIRYPKGGELPLIQQAFFEKNALHTVAKPDFAPDCPPAYLIVTYGNIAVEALKAEALLRSAGVAAGTILLELLKPYQTAADALLPFLTGSVRHVLFLEEGIRNGGAGMILTEHLRHFPELSHISFHLLAVDDSFGYSESGRSIYESCGISAQDIFDEFMGGSSADT